MNTYDSSRTFVQTQTFLVPFVPSLADHVVFVGLMSSSVDAALAKAAQLALEAAERRQKLAARVLDESHDKRPRPAATNSTKVTPEGKKVCQVVSAPGIEPRKLSFSDADSAGDGGADPATQTGLDVTSQGEEVAAPKLAQPMNIQSMMQRQATPQKAEPTDSATKATPSVGGKEGGSEPIKYAPVTAAGMKAFFDGIKKTSSTSSFDHLLEALPPNRIVLPAAPVPQIVPGEITAETQKNTREDLRLMRLYKLDDHELKQAIEKAVNHPMFATYISEVLPNTDQGDAATYSFGTEPVEDLCSFELWLEDNGLDKCQQQRLAEQAKQSPENDTLRTAPTLQLGDIDMVSPTQQQPHTATAEPNHVETQLPALQQQVVTTPPLAPASTEQPKQVNASAPAGLAQQETQQASPVATPVPEHVQPHNTVPAPVTKAAATQPKQVPTPTPADVAQQQGQKVFHVETQSPSPPPMLPDNQLGDPTLFSPAPTAKATPSTAEGPNATPSPSALEFKPVTAAGINAFFGILRRKSTDDMSVGNTISAPLPPAPVPQMLGSPSPSQAESSSAITTSQSSPAPSSKAPEPTPPTPPAPAPVPSPPVPKAPPVPTPVAGASGNVTTDDDAKEARAAYMRFYRSIRSSRAPPEVTKKFHEASQDRSGRLMRELFSSYMEANEDWLSSSIVLTSTQSQNETTAGKFGWLSKRDLLVKYHNDEALVQELVKSKVASGQSKDHPEFPGNAALRLYKVWLEDYELSENVNSTSVSHIREADGNTEGMAATGGGGGGPRDNEKDKKEKKEKKERKEPKTKTEDQLARAAIVKVNANLLEISQWQYKLSSAGVAAVVASAFVSQMDDESKNLVAAKTALETALAAGNPLSDVRQALELANEKYKTASVQIRKHAQPPKPKGKAKASAPTPPA